MNVVGLSLSASDQILPIHGRYDGQQDDAYLQLVPVRPNYYAPKKKPQTKQDPSACL